MGLTDGLNILAERNEFGKSTILAAIRGVLFERHGSQARSVVSMRHRTNKTSPLVSLEFEVAGKTYHIEKRFLHREPYARLSMSDGSVLHGEAAEEQLQRILNFSRAGNQGATIDSIGMWGALWVPQRHSVDQADLPESARQTIHGCLESEVGSLAGGTRGRKLILGAQAELAKLLNGNGKPVGRYKEAIEEVTRAKDHLGKLEAKQNALLDDIAALQTARRRLRDTDDSGQNMETEELLAQARKDREAAQRFEDQEGTEKANLQLAENRLAEAQREVDARSQRQDDIADAQKRSVAATVAELKEARALEDSKSALDRQRVQLARATTDLDAASQALRIARIQKDLATNAKILEGLERRLEQADIAQGRLDDLLTQLRAFKVSKESLDAARAIRATMQQTQAALEVQATHVSLDLLPNAGNLVRVNGRPNSFTSITVIEDTIIDIEGVGRISVSPGIKDRETLLANLSDAGGRLTGLLREMSVDTIEQAEAELELRSRCELDAKQAKAEVALYESGDKGQKVPPGVESLRSQVSALRGALVAGLTSANLDSLLEPEVALDLLRAAELHEEEVSKSVAVARAPIPELQEMYDLALKSHTRADATMNTANGGLEKLKRELEQALRRESTDALSERLRSAVNGLAVQRAVWDELQRTRPVDSVLVLDARIKRYLKAREQFFDERTRTQQEIAVLESRIGREEGIGIEEQIAAAGRAVEAFENTRDRYARDVNVLKLLLQTLQDCEHVAKERYMAPVVRRVTPYLQTLFPGSSITCDENFQITGVIREQEQSEGFGVLSVGTQEQIAVLTRLAFADMLVESGRPAMIILDDALAYSDRDRLERMFDLLSAAATRTQILILTCRGELFTRLGGTRVRATSAA